MFRGIVGVDRKGSGMKLTGAGRDKRKELKRTAGQIGPHGTSTFGDFKDNC
jgi:hypothetical protein